MGMVYFMMVYFMMVYNPEAFYTQIVRETVGIQEEFQKIMKSQSSKL